MNTDHLQRQGFDWHYGDEYHIEKQRKYLEKGWKRYKEWTHIWYEFRYFWIVEQKNKKEWEKFKEWYIEIDGAMRREKARLKREKLELDLFLKLQEKTIFQDYTDALLKDYIKKLPNSKIKKKLKPKKVKPKIHELPPFLREKEKLKVAFKKAKKMYGNTQVESMLFGQEVQIGYVLAYLSLNKLKFNDKHLYKIVSNRNATKGLLQELKAKIHKQKFGDQIFKNSLEVIEQRLKCFF